MSQKKVKKQYLSRKGYREKRIELILETINLLAKMLTLKKLELEKTPLVFFKKMKQQAETRQLIENT
jgi:hypothetical protein